MKISQLLKEGENLFSRKVVYTILTMCFLLSGQSGIVQAAGTAEENQGITLHLKNTPLKEVLQAIKQQSEYTFFYEVKDIQLDRKLSIDVNDRPIEEVLDIIFKDQPVKYTIQGKHIIIAATDTPQNAPKLGKDKNITGVVTDKKGETIVGANMSLKNDPGKGTISDVNGKFQFTAPEGGTILVSFIGYKPQEFIVSSKNEYLIQLIEDSQNLEEVVVTALGIKREEKALGYAVQKVTGENLNRVKTIDVGSTLTGKISGLTVLNSTEFNEAPTLKLRGETPLLIIDGIPYKNMTLNDIASDDIESVDVLKGATASALYGSRGSGGAILVTTKKGTKEEGISITVNSSTMFAAGYLAFPETQHAYSLGWGGKYNTDYSWGDKLDIGRTAVMYDPKTYEWREMELTSKGKNNYKNFLETSFITNNNVSVSQKGKYGSYRTSLTHVYNKGQYPNAKLNKITYTVGGEMSFDKFKLEGAATYNKRISTNNNGTGYSSSYIYDLVIWGNACYDIREFKDYWKKGKENQEQNWYDQSWYDNPYFKANEVISSSDYDMANTYLNASYELTPWLKAMLRAGLDVYTQKDVSQNSIGANGGWDPKGYFYMKRSAGYSINSDFILMADKTWNKFNLNALAGGNIYYYYTDNVAGNTANGLSVPGFYSLKASVDPAVVATSLSQKQVNSMYGKLSLSWASTYFVDVTGRNDWSSTLNADNRSYFYPSVAASVVLSEILPLPDVWSFWKVRGSWTQTKADMSVYANNNKYTINTNVWDGLATAAYPSTIIGGNVRPQSSEVFEVGTAVNFFKNRLHADVAWFRKREYDFIKNAGISSTTGFASTQINIGEELRRTGFELTIGGTPVKTQDFKWDILTNWATDRYYYNKIDPEYSTKKTWIKEGARWDWLAINDWERDPQGNIIHNGGLPVKQSFTTKVGNTNPDCVWGITNTFTYKNLSLNFTLDGRIGGLSFSRTNQLLWNSGQHIDSDNQYRYDEVVNGKLTYVGEGVKVVSGKVDRDPDGNILSDTRVFAPNDAVVSYEAYISKYHDAASKPSRQNVMDETFFKLRNLTFTYSFPQAWCQKMKMKNASVAFVGQNLFLWTKDYKFADPDKSGDSSGYENLNSPSVRYLGFNLNVTF